MTRMTMIKRKFKIKKILKKMKMRINNKLYLKIKMLFQSQHKMNPQLKRKPKTKNNKIYPKKKRKSKTKKSKFRIMGKTKLKRQNNNKNRLKRRRK